jgi:putative transposase
MEDITMKRKRHTPEQIVRKLREGDRLLSEGKDLAEVLRHLEVSESSWNRWRAQYGGMKADEAKRLKELERENSRLKKLVAEQALDIDMLKELAEGNF